RVTSASSHVSIRSNDSTIQRIPMTPLSPPTADLTQSPEVLPPRTGIWRVLYDFEDSLLVICLASMMLLPVTEILLRSIFHTGISGSSAIVQHLTLIVGMLGGAIAAREGRLL